MELVKRLSQDTQIIECEESRRLLEIFIKEKFNESIKDYRKWEISKGYRGFMDYYKLIENFQWDSYCDEFGGMDKYVKSMSLMYFKFLVENNYYSGKYREYLEKNAWVIDIKKGMYPSNTFYRGSKPYFFHEEKVSVKTESYTRFNLRAHNPVIKELLIKFISTLSSKEKKMTRYKSFIGEFENSLYVLSEPINSLNDFNYDVFRKQYRFYKKIVWGEHKATTVLIRFYIFLHEYIRENKIEHKIFRVDDFIDKYYLYKNNFSNYYEQGYGVVYLNKFDKVPETDRWMVAPNGEEKKSLARKSYEYFPINFSDIKDEQYKLMFKEWYWKCEKAIFAKDKISYIIREFLMFLYRMRKEDREPKVVSISEKKSSERKSNIITSKDIIEYRLYLKSKYNNSNTITTNLKGVKNFLEFCSMDNMIEVDLKTLYYLRGLKKSNSIPKPMTKEDLNKIIEEYKSLELSGGVVEKLQRCIVTLLTTTNLRIREILNLERDCLEENINSHHQSHRHNEDTRQRAVLKVVRKHSSGEYCEENISVFTVRVIREAIEATEELSRLADEDVRCYVFLNMTSKKIVKVLDKESVDYYLEKVIAKLELDNDVYSVYNFRDTYMTNIYDEGKKRGLTVEEIHMATGHKDISTTIKHYRDSNIKNYLEAFYGLEIGEVDIKGNIIEDIKEIEELKEVDKRKIMVSDNCGYCANEGCKDLKRVDCLICSNFVTTIDRIPYFKKRIEFLDEIIINESFEHEKDQLLKIKRLLLGYLEKLYNLKKEGVKND